MRTLKTRWGKWATTRNQRVISSTRGRLLVKPSRYRNFNIVRGQRISSQYFRRKERCFRLKTYSPRPCLPACRRWYISMKRLAADGLNAKRTGHSLLFPFRLRRKNSVARRPTRFAPRFDPIDQPHRGDTNGHPPTH